MYRPNGKKSQRCYHQSVTNGACNTCFEVVCMRCPNCGTFQPAWDKRAPEQAFCNNKCSQSWTVIQGQIEAMKVPGYREAGDSR